MTTSVECVWLKKAVVPNAEGPVLEVGSRDVQEGLLKVRACWPKGTDYLGVDQIAGPGVDEVCRWPPADMGPYRERFGTVLCVSTLEHADDPFGVARGLLEACKVGGQVAITAPFVFRYHEFPEDYWRFTPSGLMKLFGDGVEWTEVAYLGSTDKRIWSSSAEGGWRYTFSAHKFLWMHEGEHLRILEQSFSAIRGVRIK